MTAIGCRLARSTPAAVPGAAGAVEAVLHPLLLLLLHKAAGCCSSSCTWTLGQARALQTDVVGGRL